jgi:hypothetical protein
MAKSSKNVTILRLWALTYRYVILTAVIHRAAGPLPDRASKSYIDMETLIQWCSVTRAIQMARVTPRTVIEPRLAGRPLPLGRVWG